ncbi:ABC-type transport system involved in cytochrome c biogenesis, permease component [Desulfitobacterium dichloroeliminans LMG P-21439]|uniref:Heme exporter protein B n=1 Tax=Desulfitobacterium dichloroeliminans (strain LMG P-21439 / DCA1) TaxID=871963 RepID=L0F4A6_DESDL|nr:heme exporter protein CcmB [Desulfitobacterium dichloroeliminans]AGA68664.1 ABC-type transport system involved in cytochrome c biogenesis, permease component [Desulfitobacterium dichloroeliminans LMG P-21439]
MSFIHLKTLLWKEFRGEFRTKEVLSSMLVFSLLVVAAFGFALDLDRSETGKVLPGVIWVTLIFAGILALNRSFTTELQNDCIYGLMLTRASRSTIYFAKLITNLLLMAVVEIIIVPLFFIMLNYPAPPHLSLLVLVLILGTYCFMAVGTFLAALAAGTRVSEMLLPLLMLPMTMPVLLCSTLVTKGAFEIMPNDVGIYMKLLGTYAVIFTVLPALLFDHLLEV